MLFCLSVSLASIASYAQQRGIPGELYSLDAYAAMPPFGVMDGLEKLGVTILTLASLLALWEASPEKLISQTGEESFDVRDVLLLTLVYELWMLVAIGFWVCLFFPIFHTFGYSGEITGFVSIAANAILFWVKVLGLNYFLAWLKEKFPRGIPFFMTKLFILLCIGTGFIHVGRL